MELTIFDHVFAAILIVVMPVVGVVDYRRFISQVGAGKAGARLGFYRSCIAWSWGLTLAVAALWVGYRRDLPELGLGLEISIGFWIGLALTAAGCLLAVMQAAGLKRSPEKLRAAAGQLESLQEALPRSDRESREFAALSITAGICEEVLYRGYLMLYFSLLVPIGDVWVGVVLSSIAFGLAHAYQGPKGIAKTGVVGLAMAGLYLLTGSLWLPIVLHAVIDLISGSIGRAVIAMREGDCGSETD